MTRHRPSRPPVERVWGRRQLLVAGAAAAVAAVLLIGGLGYTVYLVATDHHTTKTSQRSGGGSGGGSVDVRDAITAAPMLAVDAEASRPAAPAATPPAVMRVPSATGVGPLRVPSGFPHTPAGAVGQLAAIEVAVLQGMSIDYATTVYQGWALPGGPGPAGWPLTGNVQAFLGAAAMAGSWEDGSSVQVGPVAGQIKGVDGPDWTLACVLVVVDAHIQVEARMGYGYCERMQWSPAEERWMLGPGTPAAAAPSTWPGTELARQAGWLTWSDIEGR